MCLEEGSSEDIVIRYQGQTVRVRPERSKRIIWNLLAILPHIEPIPNGKVDLSWGAGTKAISWHWHAHGHDSEGLPAEEVTS